MVKLPEEEIKELKDFKLNFAIEESAIKNMKA